MAANQDAVIQFDENIGLAISSPSPDSVLQMDDNIGVDVGASDPDAVLQMDEEVLVTSVTSFEVLPNTAQSLLVGSTLQLTALATQEDESSIDVTSVVTWPDLTPLASINSDGLLTALAHGQIAAGEEVILGAFTALLPAFDLLGLVVSIEITPADATFDEDGDVTFVATATYDDDSTSDLSDKVVWAADPPIITIVNGVVTRGPYGGVVTVTATSEDYMP